VSLAILLLAGGGGVAGAQTPAGPTSDSTISLDLKGVDILDVLKLLSQKSGLNFVAGRNVAGRVTIFASDVNVWEAFELIVEANDLAYEQRGKMINVMTARDFELIYGKKFQGRTEHLVVPLQYAKVVQVATVLNQLKSSVGRVVADETSNTVILSDVNEELEQMRSVIEQLDRPTATRVYRLNYTDAEQLKDKVQELLSPIGTLSFDVRTNTAVISDLPEVLEKTDHVVRAFDRPDGEVLIESKIIKVTLTDDFSLGIDWQRVFSFAKNAQKAGTDIKARSSFDALTGDVIAGTSKGGALQLLSSDADTTLVIQALKTIGHTETLSNPRIMVSNNQEAKILVGTREAFVTTTTTVPAGGSTVSSPTVEFVDVGTKLFVTPNIKPDGYVQMKIRPEVSSTGDPVELSGGSGGVETRIPIVTTTEAETTVLVKSGVTLIIAGLISNKTTTTDNRIPWLGNIPIIGLPFRGLSEEIEKTEVVIFMKPQILQPDGTAFVAPPDTGPISRALPEMVLKEPLPAGYSEVVRQKLQEELTSQFRAASLERGSVVLSFVVDHDGRVSDRPLVSSQQGDPFIEAAYRALASAQPFPSFPEGTRASEVRFRLAVDYNP